MAAPLRVREKAAWKTVHIPEDLLNSEEFDGVVDIQELTEYELTPVDPEEEELTISKKTKKRKRKREKEENTTAVENQDTRNSPPKKKKKKGTKEAVQNRDFDIPTNSAGNHQDLSAENDTTENVKQRTLVKKKKNKKTHSLNKAGIGVFINSHNVEIVNGDEESESSEKSENSKSVNQNQPSESPKTVKQNKKNKNISRDKLNTGSDSDGHTLTDSSKSVISETTLTNSDSQNLKKNKKKRKKKKKKAPPPQTDDSATGVSNANGDEGENEVQPAKRAEIDMSQWKNLFVPDLLLQALQDQAFENPTTIQTMVLPSAIRDRKDILGAAETGSGKTLAFGIPVLARILRSRKEKMEQAEDSQSQAQEMDTEETDNSAFDSVGKLSPNPPLALILEPTRELAIQVKTHLVALARHTDIRFATVIGGMSIEKQRRILGKKPQVIIATPGRLWQLIEEGNDHLSQVDKVHCLVVDEADRMVEKGHYEELTKLLEMINKSPRRMMNRQTFVMSATLTMDVGKPKRALKKMKKKAHEEDKLKMLTQRICIGLKPKVIDLTPKDKVAQTLTELRVNCKAEEKDFYLYYFLCQHPGRTLVFANSKDCLRRLVSVLTLLQCSPLPLHADMHQRQRLKNLDKFSENNRGLLVASDVAARGLDIPKVDHVIHYQVPRTMENYVHRSGRTARASNLGLSVMLIGPEDAKDYRKIVYGVKNGEELPLLPVEMELMPAVKLRVNLAREIDVREYRTKKKRLRNNFFTKAAEEMDMIIDDSDLLEEMGDSSEQAQDKQVIKQMKNQLSGMLKGSLAPLRMSKYPTKSGHLETKKTIHLHKTR